MKKGRKYIEPMLGKGDKKGTNIPEKKIKEKVQVVRPGMAYHGPRMIRIENNLIEYLE